jgi:sugar O-acyltransferase (sialic acid O-acetyltransferase NeuD family)
VQELIIIGGGLAVCEISNLIKAINKLKERYEIIGVLDDRFLEIGDSVFGYPVLGPLNKASDFDHCIKFVHGIGSYKSRFLRHDIFCKCAIPEERFETLIHPDVEIGEGVKIGYGCIIHKGCILGSNSIIENFSVLTYNCLIGALVRVQKYAMMASGGLLLTGAILGRGAFVGARAVISENVRIGPGALVVMGSVVMSDVKPGGAVMGFPARATFLTGDSFASDRSIKSNPEFENVPDFYLEDW